MANKNQNYGFFPFFENFYMKMRKRKAKQVYALIRILN